MHSIAVILAFVAIGYAAAAPNCPDRWHASKHGNKCYFWTPYVRLASIWDQQEFCSNIGGSVPEPKNMEEMNEVKDIVRDNLGRWTDAPFVNYITLTDETVISATSMKEIHDDKLDKYLTDNFRATNGGFKKDRCLDFTSDGFLGFDDCLSGANPMCEMNMKY